MRQVETTQCELGGAFISDIVISPKSRDDIPALLIGLQHLYMNGKARGKVFALLDAQVSPKARRDTGRPGMALWRILVLAVLRQGLNCDYDRITELANQHGTLRQMLGHGLFEHTYERQTVVDNVRLLSPELLAKISQVLVETGHEVVRKKPGETLHGRADSFCVETDVHYPTDVNLLWDAVRGAVRDTAALAGEMGIGGWRQHRHIVSRIIRKAFNRVRTAKRIKKSPAQVSEYLDICQTCLARIEKTLAAADLVGLNMLQEARVMVIQGYAEHARRQMDQIARRVFHGETIPHEEKVFSIFQPHTRWIDKGKAGVSQELGVPVCVVEDQHRFVLHHKILWQGGDVDAAVDVIAEARSRFADLTAGSFDKGFHSPSNQQQLGELLDECALPRKGRLSIRACEHQSQPWFKAAREKHPGIESAI